MAPSRVTLDLSDDIKTTRSVFIIRGERDRYVVKCCVSRRAQVGGVEYGNWLTR